MLCNFVFVGFVFDSCDCPILLGGLFCRCFVVWVLICLRMSSFGCGVCYGCLLAFGYFWLGSNLRFYFDNYCVK